MPSPLGEGQTDTPINYVHLGEVHTDSPRWDSNTTWQLQKISSTSFVTTMDGTSRQKAPLSIWRGDGGEVGLQKNTDLPLPSVFSFSASVRIEILPQYMKALRANCNSPTDFHELRQGFIPPNHCPPISFGIDHDQETQPPPYPSKTEVAASPSP